MMQRHELLSSINQRLQKFDEALLINILGIVSAIEAKREEELDQETLEILADEEAMEAIRQHEANMQKAKSLDDLKPMGYKTLDEVLAERGLSV